MSSGKAKINVAVAISDVADFYEKENINDFSAWLAASAAQDAYYKIHPNGGFLMKQDMGAMPTFISVYECGSGIYCFQNADTS